MGIALYALLFALPAACFKLLLAGLAAWSRYSARPRTATAAPVDQERIRRDLRRLAETHARLLLGDAPAKGARLHAIELAYDDTLRHACRALEIDAPARPLDATTRLLIEADLVRLGLDW